MIGGNDRYVAIVHDLTERKKKIEEHDKLQAMFSQAQKMETVGQLAGGVAHDFNNMLSVIIGFTDLALDKVAGDDPLRKDLEEVQGAARRATEVTRQLLAFARKQTIAPQVLDLNESIEKMLSMLRRLIGEDIELTLQPGPGKTFIYMDHSQIDQILSNLCVNAKHAIDGVGTIAIETDIVSFDEAYCAQHAGFIPGVYVMMAVSDDGCGMDKETLLHVFEPFYTTKEVDEGTGLGLSMVYGIVKQNHGFINVYSEPGSGTVFRIYLPQHEGDRPESEVYHAVDDTSSVQGKTVLVVEDEPAILELARQVLHRQGYNVLTASVPSQAITLATNYASGIDLVITDVVMPEMNGRELAMKLQPLFPNLIVLYMSGYTANVIVKRGVLENELNFIQKPFSIQALAKKVRDVLNHSCDSD